MTQEELGVQLGKVTGTRWSRATVSHAEQGWGASPGRVRHFDVNEVAAFALVLRVPIPWFFLPPGAQPTGYPSSPDEAWITTREDDCEVALSRNAMVSMAVPSPQQASSEDLYFQRLWTEFATFVSGSSDPRTEMFLKRLSNLVEEFTENRP